MEIQFSIPISTGRSNAPTEPNQSTPNTRDTSPASAKAGTHRFALETRTRHTRRSSTRARTGCSTCKKRHVKCDETRPSCLNCMKWRGYCDAYTDSNESHSANTKQAKLIHTKKAPLIVTEPLVNIVRFANEDQRAYFDEWSRLSVTFLSGGLNQARLWTATMPQVTLEDTTLRYGAMAVGALRKAQADENQATLPSSTNKHYLNAMIYYCEALRLQSKSTPDKEGLRTALLSSLLFICFETQRGNMPVALKHIVHGFSMLNELAACSDKASDLVSIAPAPPALVQEILDCYKPLELQSRSFMGSYKKFFFSSPQQDPTNKGAMSPQFGSPLSSIRSPPSEPGTPWHVPPAQTANIGLPSPQSQGSPQSQADSSPLRGPPARPPGIAPFAKHTPYFRPKRTGITSLNDLPHMFQDFDEAHGYWSLVQRQMVQHIPILMMTTSQLALTKATDEAELEAKLSSIKQNPRISKFIAESRYWLQRWVEAYDPLYQSFVQKAKSDIQSYLQAINLRIEYLILYIYTAIPRYSGLTTAKALTPKYREINVLAEQLLKARPSCGFAMDSGWTWPLFVSSFGCRDRDVREDAIRILGQYPIRNALRDSRVFRAISLKNKEIEDANVLEGDENEQWLRLRRRELVFEDFGTNIIFRSAMKDPFADRWVLVEERAEFSMDWSGRLVWHQQPISDSASILSGVC